MIIVFVALCLVATVFAGVLLRGAPYVPTLDKQAKIAIDLIDLKPGQTLLELGSGDGKVLVVAAQAGLQVVGIELNPILVVVSWVRTRRYRKQVRIVWGDFWVKEWPDCDGVFVFLLDRFMTRLDMRMKDVGKPLVSFAFRVPGKTAAKQRDGVFLYRY